MTDPLSFHHLRERLWEHGGWQQERWKHLEPIEIKETHSPRRRLLSAPPFLLQDIRQRYFGHRHREMWTNEILHLLPPDSYEMNELEDGDIKRENVIKTNMTSPGPVLDLFRPPNVISSEAVPSLPLEARSTTVEGPSHSITLPPERPTITDGRNSYNIMPTTQHEHPREQESIFDSNLTNDWTLWEEWSNITRRRSRILSLRSRIHEMRGTLREMQNAKSITEDRLIQRLLQRELAIESPQKASTGSILELIEDCQSARDDFGPFEEKCTSLEDELYRDEFLLHRLEEDFYLRCNILPDLHEGGLDLYQGKDENENVEYHEGVRNNYEEVKLHPLVDHYLSKQGDLDILEEQLYEFEERLASLEEDRKSRDRYGLLLDPEDDEFRKNSQATRSRILKQMQRVKNEVEELRQECFLMKLIDEHGEPNSSESNQWTKFEADEDIDSGSEVSEYSKYAILMTQPEPSHLEIANMPAKAPSQFHSQPVEDLQQTTSPFYQVQFWMLMILRSSAIDVNHLARWSDEKEIIDGDIWQQRVLDLWFQDDIDPPGSRPATRSKSNSIRTQHPRQPKNPEYCQHLKIKLPILKNSESPMYFIPFSTDKSDITEIEDILGLDE